MGKTEQIILKINYIANQGYVYLCSKYAQALGHETIFYTDGRVHPHLSVGWFTEELSEEERPEYGLPI